MSEMFSPFDIQPQNEYQYGNSGRHGEGHTTTHSTIFYVDMVECRWRPMANQSHIGWDLVVSYRHGGKTGRFLGAWGLPPSLGSWPGPQYRESERQ